MKCLDITTDRLFSGGSAYRKDLQSLWQRLKTIFPFGLNMGLRLTTELYRVFPPDLIFKLNIH